MEHGGVNLNLTSSLGEMSIIHIGTSGEGGGASRATRTLFTGPQVPHAIKVMRKPLTQIDKTLLRRILQVIVHDLEGNEVSEVTYQKLKSDSVTEETLATVYTGLYELLRAALRLPLASLKQRVFQEDLQEMQLPADFIPDITSVVFGARRTAIDRSALQSRPRSLTLTSFRWRVDVAISTNVLSRVLEPSITMRLVLSDGTIHDFEVSVTQFQKLRYSVASVLREMGRLEKRSILKMIDSSQ